MATGQSTFSRRFGFRQTEAEITVREDAPEALREGIVMLAEKLGLRPHAARDAVCQVLLKAPDPANWSPYPNVANEVQFLIASAPWYRVYDIAEVFHARLSESDAQKGKEFEERLNELFLEHGIGWLMQDGQIVVRGSEAFSHASKTASEGMAQTGLQTAAREMHEALLDISRRPHADVTGAIQHAMAALECAARHVSGEHTKTLGQIIARLELPKPLDAALEKLWGFTSEQGRHLREGRSPEFEDAQLVVTVASAVCTFLLSRPKSVIAP